MHTYNTREPNNHVWGTWNILTKLGMIRRRKTFGPSHLHSLSLVIGYSSIPKQVQNSALPL